MLINWLTVLLKRLTDTDRLLIGKNAVTWPTLMTREDGKHGLNRSSPFRPVKQREIGRLWGGPWDLGQETQPGFSQDWEQSTNAFELWCWRRLLRVPWSARRSNQSILKEISLEYSLEGLMLKLKLQYFGHLTRRTTHWKRPRSWERLRRRRG